MIWKVNLKQKASSRKVKSSLIAESAESRGVRPIPQALLNSGIPLHLHGMIDRDLILFLLPLRFLRLIFFFDMIAML